MYLPVAKGISFKDISTFSSGGHVVQLNDETFLRNYFEFGPIVQEILFKDIYYLEPWWAFRSAQPTNLFNFGRGHYVEHFCEKY